MVIRRFFVKKENVNNDTIYIDGDEHNHLKNVLRLKEKTPIIVVCGDEWDYNCIITSIDKSVTQAKIVDITKNIYNPKTKVTVFQGLSKKDTMSNLVQKLNELGVSYFVPLITEFAVAKDVSGKQEKLQSISNNSAKQCKRSIPLKVEESLTITQASKDLDKYDLVIFANEAENQLKVSNLFEKKLYNNIAIIVGSEGGFSQNESALLIKNGAKSITLGKRILRVETACIAITTLIMNYVGEI